MTSDRLVTVVGVGALGSNLLLLARNWPVRFKIIDFDRVEQKNVLAQFHTKMGLGRNKAQALQQTFQGLFGLKIDAIPHRLVAENAEALLGGSALIIDCTDNAAARRLIQGHAVAGAIPCVHGALSADGTFARIVFSEHFKADEEGAPGAATCEDGALLPFFALAAAQLAQIGQRFIEHGERRSVQLTPFGVVRLA